MAGNGFYPNTTIAVHCYQSGAGNVPGSADTMWEQASVVGGSGTGSGWINEHFINDGAAINQPSPGVPPCNAPPPAPTPHADSRTHSCPSGGSLVFPVYNADGGVYYRNSPNQGDTSQTPGVGVYNGDQVELICGQIGGRRTQWQYGLELCPEPDAARASATAGSMSTSSTTALRSMRCQRASRHHVRGDVPGSVRRLRARARIRRRRRRRLDPGALVDAQLHGDRLARFGRAIRSKP